MPTVSKPSSIQQPNNEILVDTGIQVIKEYNNTGYLTFDGSIILAFSTLALITSMVTSIINFIKTGETVKKNVVAYLSKEDFSDNEYIEDILEEMLKVSQSDRVCVGILHNGVNWGAIHFAKMTVKYEARATGVESVKKKFKDVDIERISEEINKSCNEDFTYFSRQQEHLNGGCIAYMDSLGIKNVYTRLLKSKESMGGKLFKKIIKPKEVGVYAILELQKMSNERNLEDYLQTNKEAKQQLEDLYQKLVWCMEKVRKGKKIVRK